MAIITTQVCKCDKCGHVWLPRDGLVDKTKWPVSCAKCKNARWNRGTGPVKKKVSK